MRLIRSRFVTPPTPAPSATPAAHPAESGEPAASAAERVGCQVAVVVLADVAAGHRWWGWSRIVLGPRRLRDVPGLRFAKVLGSGHEGGFGLRPSLSCQGLFLLFADEAAADAFLDASSVMASYRARCRELCSIKLRAWSSRGSWNGTRLAPSSAVPDDGPVAALTRASIRLPSAFEFWRKAPAAQVALAGAPGCRLAAGLGEAPLLRQATFSVWDSVRAMDAYARSGAHLEAIHAAHRGRYFSESMFVRFVPVSIQGVWQGVRHR